MNLWTRVLNATNKMKGNGLEKILLTDHKRPHVTRCCYLIAYIYNDSTYDTTLVVFFVIPIKH